jgi:hypothetical protein
MMISNACITDEIVWQLRNWTVWTSDSVTTSGWQQAGFRRDIQSADVPVSASIPLFASPGVCTTSSAAPTAKT